MKILVLGATGGTGRAAVKELVARGHQVTALVRRPQTFGSDAVRVVEGDVMQPASIERALVGQDAALVVLGISENPMRVRLFGPRHTPLDVRSVGTRNLVAAMQRQGVRRLVVQTTHGLGETRSSLTFKWRLIFDLLLKPQLADTERQEAVVRESGLDWTLARPVGLTDDTLGEDAVVSTAGEAKSMHIARNAVARFLAKALESNQWMHQAVSLSSP